MALEKRGQRRCTRNISIATCASPARPRQPNASRITPASAIASAGAATARTMDWMEQEPQRRGNHHHLRSRPVSGTAPKQYPRHRINIIDTPGHVNFTVEVRRSCAFWTTWSPCIAPVGEGAHAVGNSVQASRYSVPRIIENKMDRSSYELRSSLTKRLGAKAVAYCRFLSVRSQLKSHH